MAENNNLLNELFQMYHQSAIKAKASGNKALEKKNLVLAAETLLKMAKEDTAELKKVRITRAQGLIKMAEAIDLTAPKKTQNAPSSGSSDSEITPEDNPWKVASIPNIRFSDVAGLHSVKKAITTRMINPIKYPEKYEAYNKKTGGGVLLYGPPGTGKTMIAKAIACEVGAVFYTVKGSDIVSKWVGESEKNISMLFDCARKDPLAIIFIDEMDSLFGQRGQDPHNDRRVNEFLQQIDGFMGKAKNLLLLGATNRPWDIDGAAVRSGRFSEKIYVPLPDYDARKYLFQKQLSKLPLATDIDLDEITRLSEGYSGADIDEICDLAKEGPLDQYIRTNVLTPISRNDVLKAISHVRPMVNPKEIARFEEYAGINKSYLEEQEQKETPEVKPVVSPKTSSNLYEFTYVEDRIQLLPDTFPQIHFAINKDVSTDVFANLNGNHYLCSFENNQYVIKEVQIQTPGEYELHISIENTTLSHTIRFIKGLEEDNLEL